MFWWLKSKHIAIEISVCLEIFCHQNFFRRWRNCIALIKQWEIFILTYHVHSWRAYTLCPWIITNHFFLANLHVNLDPLRFIMSLMPVFIYTLLFTLHILAATFNSERLWTTHLIMHLGFNFSCFRVNFLCKHHFMRNLAKVCCIEILTWYLMIALTVALEEITCISFHRVYFVHNFSSRGIVK